MGGGAGAGGCAGSKAGAVTLPLFTSGTATGGLESHPENNIKSAQGTARAARPILLTSFGRESISIDKKLRSWIEATAAAKVVPVAPGTEVNDSPDDKL